MDDNLNVEHYLCWLLLLGRQMFCSYWLLMHVKFFFPFCHSLCYKHVRLAFFISNHLSDSNHFPSSFCHLIALWFWICSCHVHQHCCFEVHKRWVQWLIDVSSEFLLECSSFYFLLNLSQVLHCTWLQNLWENNLTTTLRICGLLESFCMWYLCITNKTEKKRNEKSHRSSKY